MAGKRATKSEPEPNPFLQLMSLHSRRLFYFKGLVDFTCAKRMGRRFSHRNLGPLRFVLDDQPGAAEAANEFGRQVREKPPPEHLTEILELVRKCRRVTAAAGIAFESCDAVFLEVEARYRNLLEAGVSDPHYYTGILSKQNLVQIDQVFLQEIHACEAAIYQRLRAFSDQAIGRGLVADPSKHEASPKKAVRPVRRDRATEARDKWIYQQCCKGIAYTKISIQLNDKPDWEPITSKQGIPLAAKRYAKRHGLKPPAPRRSK